MRAERRQRWSYHGEAETCAEADLYLTLDRDHGFADLRYELKPWTDRAEPQRQRVELVSTPCRFGGRRWWWLCPGTRRRCATLYLPAGGSRFLSRSAYQVAYASQNGTAIDRSHGRISRLHRNPGGDYTCLNDPLLPRPKWMGHRIYGGLLVAWEKALNRHEQIFAAGAGRLATRLEL